MTTKQTVEDSIGSIAALAEPTRRALYDLVVASSEPVGRDDAVTALGISRDLAAFHLDRLVDAGLLQTTYRRRNGRTGPGAGRPAKLYERAERDVEVSLPPRHYERAAELMATALERSADTVAITTLANVAREQGEAVGAGARRRRAGRSGRVRPLDRLGDLLRGAGYEPQIEPDGDLCLRNCPFAALVEAHRDVICGMNLAWAHGVVDGSGIPGIDLELAPDPDRCCVVFHSGRTAPDGRPAPTTETTT